MTRTSFNGRLLTSVALSMLIGAIAAPALAQQAAPVAAPTPAPQEEATDVGEVVVTASRVSRAGYQAPTPTTVVGEEQLEASAPANIADAVNDLPQLAPSSTPSTGNGSVSGGTQGANFLNLRGLGTNRTLTLLDGHRVVGSALTGAVDVNLLPSSLVQRVEVVTGGASAAWGSDAVAGVVNFVLNRTFTGLKVEAQYGISEEGDVESHKFEVTYGTPFANERGHFIFSGLVSDVAESNRANTRDWFTGSQIINNPAWTATNGQPRTILQARVGSAAGTPGGSIMSGPLQGLQFGPGGTVLPYDLGFRSGSQQIGGTYVDYAGTAVLQAPLESQTAYSRISYDLTDTLKVFAELSYGKSVTEYRSIQNARFNNITIRNDNAFLPAEIRTRMATAGVTSFLLSRRNDDVGFILTDYERELTRGLVGAEGSFGKGWTWDAYYQHGRSEVANAVGSNLILSRYAGAIDSVLDVPTNTIVCRSRAVGCVPFNPFGLGSPSQAARDYVSGTALQNVLLVQDVVAASVQGDTFSVPAGPVSIAAGVEYRKDKLDADADPISIATDFAFGNYKPSAGEYDVKEIFGEVVVPVIRDMAFGKALDLNGAVRYTEYSTSGGVTTWKLGATYDLNDQIRIRATRSEDIRAPNLSDLFLGGQTSTGNITDPRIGNTPVTIQTVTRGNPDLMPEVASTKTAGIVFRPSFFKGFQASIDWYEIDIADAITAPNAQTIITQCEAGATALCSQVLRSGAGALTQIIVIPLNAQSQLVSGFDIEATYTSDLEWAGLPGRVSLRGLAANVQDLETTTSGVTDVGLGELSNQGPPKWRFNGSATYLIDRASATVSVRHIADGIFDNTYTPAILDYNRIPGRTYWDVSGRFEMTSVVEVFGVVENLFDESPPPSPLLGGGATQGPGVAGQYFDLIGRQFRAGVRLRF